MWRVLLSTLLNIVVCMDPTTKDLVTPLKQLGEACGYESCANLVEGLLNVHIVPHSHGELGYTRTFYQHYTGHDDFYDKSNINMKRILDYTISELWAREQRTFTLSDLPYFFHWWANRDETVHRMVYQLLRQGRLSLVGGGWSMADEATSSYHALIDQFTYALRKLNATFLECGRPLVSWQADSFAHSREFASLIAQMAFDAHFISPISFDDELRRMRGKELEMLWRGSDDLGVETDVFTHKLFDGYWSPPGFCFGSLCSDPLMVVSDSQFQNMDERAELFKKLMFERQAPHYATNNVLVVMGKRLGYHDAPIWFENIDRLIEVVNTRGEGKIRLFYSSPACYLKAVHSKNPVLPLKQDDFVPVSYDKNSFFSGLFTSRPTLKYMAREGHVLLQIAKQLQVLAKLPDNSKMFEEFNWVMGAFQDHNIITGSLRPHVKDYYTEKMYIAVQKSTLLFRQAFNELRKILSGTMYYRCSFNISSCGITNKERYFVSSKSVQPLRRDCKTNLRKLSHLCYEQSSKIVIYNPLSWPVSLPVRLPIADVSEFKFSILQPNQQNVKSVIMKLPNAVIKIPNRFDILDHELVFISQDIPALGYRSYYIEKYNKTKRNVTRITRSIIKKINKNKNKKYLIRQTNNMKIDDESLLDNVDPNHDYDDYDDYSMKSKIEFGNVSANAEYNNDESDILTPKPRVTEETTTVEITEEPVTIMVDDVTENESTSTTEKTETTMEDTIEENKLYVSSKDRFISNKYINISLDSSRQITSVSLSNGVKMALKIHINYYASDDPQKMGRGSEKAPGAYIFRPMDPKPVQIKDFINVDVLKTEIVEELHTAFSEYASFALKLYTEKPVIEVDWVVGPIPIDDDIGKDVFVRYETDLKNNGVFYTDSNGRQTIKRIRNERIDYEPMNAGDIAGNIYPVTSKIFIEDLEKNIRFSVFNDRAQGGTSLNQGQIDLMVHRRILTDDSGIQSFLNDTVNGKGIIVRGRHYLYISKGNYKPHKIFEKKFAKEIELAPQVFVSRSNPYFNQSRDIWLMSKNDYSGLKKKLPIGVHLLTLQQWNEGTLLLRLENYLEKADTVKDGIKIVFLKDLFVNIRVKDVKETTLDGSKWLKDWVPLQWQRKEEFYENFNDAFGGNRTTRRPADSLEPLREANVDAGIKLTPQQIRTFVVQFDYVDI